MESHVFYDFMRESQQRTHARQDLRPKNDISRASSATRRQIDFNTLGSSSTFEQTNDYIAKTYGIKQPVTVYRSPLYSYKPDRGVERSFSGSRSSACVRRYEFPLREADLTHLKAYHDVLQTHQQDRLCDISNSLIDQISRLERENRINSSQDIAAKRYQDDFYKELAAENMDLEPVAFHDVPVRQPEIQAEKQLASSKSRNYEEKQTVELTSERQKTQLSQSRRLKQNDLFARLSAPKYQSDQKHSSRSSSRQASGSTVRENASTPAKHVSRSPSQGRERSSKPAHKEETSSQSTFYAQESPKLLDFQKMYAYKQWLKQQSEELAKSRHETYDIEQEEAPEMQASSAYWDLQSRSPTQQEPVKKKAKKPTRRSKAAESGFSKQSDAKEAQISSIHQNKADSPTPAEINLNISLKKSLTPKNAHYDVKAYRKPVFERLNDPAFFTGHYAAIYQNRAKEPAPNDLPLQETLREGFRREGSVRSNQQKRSLSASKPAPAHFGKYDPESLDKTRITGKVTHYDEGGQRMSVYDRLASPKYFTGQYKAIFRTQKEQQSERQQMLGANLSQFLRPEQHDYKRPPSKYRSRSAFERSHSAGRNTYREAEPPIYEKLTNKDFYTGTAFNTFNNGKFCRDYAGSTHLPRSFKNMTDEQRTFFEYMNYISRDKVRNE